MSDKEAPVGEVELESGIDPLMDKIDQYQETFGTILLIWAIIQYIMTH